MTPLQHNMTILWMRRGILILTCYICNSTHLIAILRFRKKQKQKKNAPCLVLQQNKSCVCVGGILWIQGQSKNGPAMVFFFGWKFCKLFSRKFAKISTRYASLHFVKEGLLYFSWNGRRSLLRRWIRIKNTVDET